MVTKTRVFALGQDVLTSPKTFEGINFETNFKTTERAENLKLLYNFESRNKKNFHQPNLQ